MLIPKLFGLQLQSEQRKHLFTVTVIQLFVCNFHSKLCFQQREYSLTRNYVQLRETIFISCSYAKFSNDNNMCFTNYGMVSYYVILRNYALITRN